MTPTAAARASQAAAANRATKSARTGNKTLSPGSRCPAPVLLPARLGNFHASRSKISLIDIKRQNAGPVTIRMKFFRAAP